MAPGDLIAFTPGGDIKAPAWYRTPSGNKPAGSVLRGTLLLVISCKKVENRFNGQPAFYWDVDYLALGTGDPAVRSSSIGNASYRHVTQRAQK